MSIYKERDSFYKPVTLENPDQYIKPELYQLS